MHNFDTSIYYGNQSREMVGFMNTNFIGDHDTKIYNCLCLLLNRCCCQLDVQSTRYIVALSTIGAITCQTHIHVKRDI